MKNIIFTAFLAIVIVSVYAFENPKVTFKANTKEGIQFHKGTWDEVLQIAKKENKLIFLDVCATSYEPCKKLKKNTFSTTEVGRIFNQRFVCLAFDGEQEDGAKWTQKYKLRRFPSLLFMDGKGKVVAQTGGYHESNNLIELGNQFT